MQFSFNNFPPQKFIRKDHLDESLFSYQINFNASLKHLILKTSDYVPLYALNFPTCNTYSAPNPHNMGHTFNGWYSDYDTAAKEAIKKTLVYEEGLEQKNYLLSKYIVCDVNRSPFTGGLSKEDLVNNELESLIARVLEVKKDFASDDLTLSVNGIKSYYGRTSYNKIFDKVTGERANLTWGSSSLGFEVDQLRLHSYLSNYGFCAKINWDSVAPGVPHLRELKGIKNIEVLFSYMVKVEMIPYIKLCMVLGEEPHPDSLELWVSDKLDVPKGEYKNIRPKYRKRVKLFAESRGIKIEESSNLNADIFKTCKLPTFKTMQDRRIWYNFISSGVLNSLKRMHSTEGQKVKLTL